MVVLGGALSQEEQAEQETEEGSASFHADPERSHLQEEEESFEILEDDDDETPEAMLSRSGGGGGEDVSADSSAGGAAGGGSTGGGGGGGGGGPLFAELYDVMQDKWVPLPPIPGLNGRPLHGVGAAAVGTCIIVGGAENKTRLFGAILIQQ
jgi:hypothetical protein